MTSDQPVRPQSTEPRQPRIAFEKERGVSSVKALGRYAYLTVFRDTARQQPGLELEVYGALAESKISINLVKLHQSGVSFVVNEDEEQAARVALAHLGLPITSTSPVSMVSVYAAGMRLLNGVMARIAGALLKAGVAIVQTGDGPDTVFCLVESALAPTAVSVLCAEFDVAPTQAPIVVQKFGGKSVGTAEARALAVERIQEAIDEGYRPVVVVSAIGRRGEPYATDTLLEQLDAVDPGTEPSLRERDMLMACGEIISTVIMAQTLKARGLRAVALTGAQAGILTDFSYGDAQIVDIDATYIRELLYPENVDDQVDVVVVAGFQGVTAKGAITTLGRGGSDTTASALGAALQAEKVEIYTHVNGVMTADPEVVKDARTLAMVTYEEVCNMAHQGAKVLHPRAAEIAMMHQIPLWVKSSFERAPGTLVAPLEAIQPASKRAVTGVATISNLVYFTLTGQAPETRGQAEFRIFQALGAHSISMYLNSVGPTTSSFIVEQSAARQVETLLRELSLEYTLCENCEMVSVVALRMWEEPGFLHSIAQALFEAGIGMLQMADSEGTVSCLVSRDDAPRAVNALHHRFLGSK